MSNQTKILVLHMKELVYTAIFLALAIILGILLFSMFGKDNKQTTETGTQLYAPGVYHRSLELAGNDIELQVVVDKQSLSDLSFDAESQYTSSLLLNAISQTLDECRVKE